MGVHYQLSAAEEIVAGTTYANRVGQILADVPVPVPVDGILHMSFWNLPMVGPKLKLSLKPMVEVCQLEITQAPKTSCILMIPPNTPAWGMGQKVGTEFEAGILAHQQAVLLALNEAQGILAVACSAIFDESCLANGLDRGLRIEFWMIISDSKHVAKDEYISMWAKSALFHWRALPTPVEVMPRQEFQDWTSTNVLFDKAKVLNAVLERKQHFSGMSLLGAMVRTALKNLNLAAGSRMQLRDYTCYDDRLCSCVAEMNGSKDAKDKNFPMIQYVGLVWTGSHPQTVVANVREAVHDALASRLRGDLPLGGVSQSFTLQIKAAPAVDNTLRPRLQEEQFEITCPRGEELPVRQTIYDKWAQTSCTVTLRAPAVAGGAAMLETVLGWKDMIKLHDDEYNPSGVPFKTRRAPETDIEALASNQPPAAVTWPVDPDSPDEATCMTRHHAKKLSGTGHVDLYSFLVTRTGGLYVLAEKDGTIPHDDSLFIIRGAPKVGAPADAIMKNGEAWIEYNLTAEQEVSMSFAAAVRGGEFPQGPEPLHKALKFLDDHNYVRVALHSHELIKNIDEPHGWTVKSKEPAALDVPIIETHTEADLTFNKMASYLSLPALKTCPLLKIVPKLQFNPSTNKINVGMPAAYPKAPVTVTKGQLYKLF